jgi:hypothetical protein
LKPPLRAFCHQVPLQGLPTPYGRSLRLYRQPPCWRSVSPPGRDARATNGSESAGTRLPASGPSRRDGGGTRKVRQACQGVGNPRRRVWWPQALRREFIRQARRARCPVLKEPGAMPGCIAPGSFASQTRVTSQSREKAAAWSAGWRTSLAAAPIPRRLAC